MPNLELTPILARVFVTASMYVLLRTFSRSPYAHALIWWPATVLHEASHFLLGVVLRAKPVGFSLWPKRVPGTNRFILGHVAFANLNWWKKLPVVTAPLLLLPSGIWLILKSLQAPHTQAVNLLFSFCSLQCLVGCWPSPEDWAHARTTIYVIFGVSIVGLGAFFLLRF